MKETLECHDSIVGQRLHPYGYFDTNKAESRGSCRKPDYSGSSQHIFLLPQDRRHGVPGHRGAGHRHFADPAHALSGAVDAAGPVRRVLRPIQRRPRSPNRARGRATGQRRGADPGQPRAASTGRAGGAGPRCGCTGVRQEAAGFPEPLSHRTERPRQHHQPVVLRRRSPAGGPGADRPVEQVFPAAREHLHLGPGRDAGGAARRSPGQVGQSQCRSAGLPEGARYRQHQRPDLARGGAGEPAGAAPDGERRGAGAGPRRARGTAGRHAGRTAGDHALHRQRRDRARAGHHAGNAGAARIAPLRSRVPLHGELALRAAAR